MSARPIRKKQANRMRKALRVPLPRYISLFEWLEDHRYADTTGQARTIILAGRVKSESHTLGIKTYKSVDGKDVPYVDPIVPVSVLPTLRVSA